MIRSWIYCTEPLKLYFDGIEAMLQYEAGYKFVGGGVHAAAITCGADLAEARKLLAVALIDVAETCLELGQPLPQPNPQVSDPEMDLEEPIYLHLRASSEVPEVPAGAVVP